MQTGAATVENSMDFPQKTKNANALWPRNSTLEIYLKKSDILIQKNKFVFLKLYYGQSTLIVRVNQDVLLYISALEAYWSELKFQWEGLDGVCDTESQHAVTSTPRLAPASSKADLCWSASD